MPPKDNASSSSATIQITLKTISASETYITPQIVFQFPQQQPMTMEISKSSRSVSAKKSSRQKEPIQQLAEYVKVEPTIQKEFEIPNPDNCIQSFIADQLKIFFDDPSLKGKVPAQFISYDCSCFLVSLQLQELIQLQINEFTYNAELTIRIVSSRHENQRVTSFLSPKTFPVLSFKILKASKIFQYADPEWRQRYLQPLKVECKILGNTYFSEPIDQIALGSDRKSVEFKIRLITAYACKTENEIYLIKRQIEENFVEITVHCRVPKNKIQVEKPKSAQTKSAVPIINDSFINFTAECKISLKQLLVERIFEEEVKLVPKYQLNGKTQVPDLGKMHNNQLDRQPLFQTVSILPQVKDVKQKEPVPEVTKQTQFSEYQKAPETLPLGDWSESFVSVRAAFQRPLSSWQIQTKETPSRSNSAKNSKNQVVGQNNIIQLENMVKPNFQHFERMYIYLGAKHNEMVKQILQYVAAKNLLFISENSQKSFKDKFSDDANDRLSDFIGLLSTSNVSDAISNPDLHSLNYQFITGYRFIDKHTQLIFLECPAQFDSFKDLRLILDQVGCTYKSAPAVSFRKRSLPKSAFLLLHFSLVKPIVKLSLQFSQKIGLVQKYIQLFNIVDNKLFPLEPVKMDLRGFQQADLFFDQNDIDQLIENFAGNIPKQADINFLFMDNDVEKFDDLTSVQRSIVSGSHDTMSSFSKSENTSPVAQKQINKVKEKQIKILTIKHRPIPQAPELIPIPEELLVVSPTESPRASQKYLPQYQINIQSGIINNSESDCPNQAIQKDKILENVSNDIFLGTALKGESIIKQVLEGKRTFQYSSQTLNKYSIQARILDKTLNGKNLQTEIDVQQPTLNKLDPLYIKERNWK
ncbi:hypothetical protein SS50377_22258 [Spironucleus salmonicida]|uniref:Uncharacterized protein n=1 Tax=Spironucleus salmonicida TaxID=348837 RepID=V6LDD1_9EUKA|nr:hypothetical protein SS50377_22258 [Spironucleus salmonicida]|eukprot:EST42248.1 hypothetical protein SS50377_18550 [Spironucleus salmonicida]